MRRSTVCPQQPHDLGKKGEKGRYTRVANGVVEKRGQQPRSGDCETRPGPRGRYIDRSTDLSESNSNEHSSPKCEQWQCGWKRGRSHRRNADAEKPPNQKYRRKIQPV